MDEKQELDEKKSYKKLEVWQKGYELSLLTYEVTSKFPKNEEYGLKPQMTRCAVSIPSNIAEGYMRQHRKEYINFLSIALGSAAELETQALIARDTNLVNHESYDQIEQLSGSIIAMLTKLIKVLKGKGDV